MVEEARVALVVTAHQPDERLLPLAEAEVPRLAGRYGALVAYCSRETVPAFPALLRGHGARVEIDSRPPQGIETIGAVRRAALGAGLAAGTTHLHLCDFDRALHWSAHYPAEMAAVAAAIVDYDLLVLGRTAQAWTSHPPYQAETEPLFNRVFELATGLAWDVGAGARGLSRRAGEALLAASQEATVGVDAEWPLLLLRRDGYRVGYRACEGLAFETADRFGPEIEAAGGYGAWEAQMSADPGRWAFRLRVAQLIAEAVVRYHPGQGDD